MRRLPPLNALRSFEAAARHGSFNKAAEELFVTPSAVSHQIKSLEEFLGSILFERVKRAVHLTATGERYLVSVQSALDEIDTATRKLMASANGGIINLSVAPAFLTRWLVPRISHFQERFPTTELRLTASINPVDFHSTDMDMAIFYGDGHWPGLDATFLRTVHTIPVCSPKLLAGKKPITSAEDLLDYPLIHVSNRNQEWKQILQDAGVKKYEHAKNISFSNASLAIGAAMEGLGIALADLGLAERELQDGHLIKPIDLALETSNAFYLVYPQNRSLSTDMISFKEWLLEEMSLEQKKQA